MKLTTTILVIIGAAVIFGSKCQAQSKPIESKVLEALDRLKKKVDELSKENEQLKNRVKELESFVGDTKTKKQDATPNGCPSIGRVIDVPPTPSGQNPPIQIEEIPMPNTVDKTAPEIPPLPSGELIGEDHFSAEKKKSGLDARIESIVEKFTWRSKNFTIRPFGQLRGEAIYSEAAQSADATIFFLNPRDPRFHEDQFTVHGKTSMLNFAITGPKLGAFQTGGMIIMNFTGSQPLRNLSGPNLFNAYGEIKNDYWRFAFGRMFDLFGPINPSTVNLGQQRGAGNLGIWRGAIHVDRYFTPSCYSKWTLSGRISQQDVNDFLVVPTVRGTDNGLPNFEGRIGWEIGPTIDGHKVLEIGVSGLYGQTRAVDPVGLVFEGIVLPPGQAVSDSWGVNLDVQLQWKHFGIRGEIWTGQAAGTYFMAGLQSLNPLLGTPIRSTGGWGEVYVKPNDHLRFSVGYSLDDPRNRDLGFFTANGPGQRARNQVIWGNVIWDVTDYFQLGFEVSHRETDYLNDINSNSGMTYHFSSMLKF